MRTEKGRDERERERANGETRGKEREGKAASGYRRSLSVPLLRKVTND